jgi:multicomponent Na+:H+ antiporter subunit E
MNVFKWIRFIFFYIRELLAANLKVAHDILTPSLNIQPAVIAVPLGSLTDVQLLALANLITMTPGTLSLDISADRKTLFVHAMYVDDPEALVRDIKQGLEKQILEL